MYQPQYRYMCWAEKLSTEAKVSTIDSEIIYSLLK